MTSIGETYKYSDTKCKSISTAMKCSFTTKHNSSHTINCELLIREASLFYEAKWWKSTRSRPLKGQGQGVVGAQVSQSSGKRSLKSQVLASPHRDLSFTTTVLRAWAGCGGILM